MPRPRTIDDETVLATAAGLIGRIGPGQVTLQRVAEEVGLSAATLVQRFGSKRELLLAIARSGAAEAFARAPSGSPLETLVGGLAESVASTLAFAGVGTRIVPVALPDEFLAAGALPTLHDRYGLSTDAIVSRIKAELGGTADPTPPTA